jgi:hypothetical protein
MQTDYHLYEEPGPTAALVWASDPSRSLSAMRQCAGSEVRCISAKTPA